MVKKIISIKGDDTIKSIIQNISSIKKMNYNKSIRLNKISGMFCGCASLIAFNIYGKFNTSTVSNMSYRFY